ncbi:MAG: putative porin [Proteobacteria bacterium]|nr:putative porin [Pseudomonadota bacterium]
MIKFLSFVTLLLLFVCLPVTAETDTATELERLQAQLKALTAQVNRLEKRLQSEQSQEKNQSSQETKQPQTSEKPEPAIQFSGDMRGRYEYIDFRDRSIRQRSRIRLRLAAEAHINESTSLHMRLSTGGYNPTSTNLTLDGGFSRKDFGLDRAYIKHQLTNQQQLLLGKMSNPYQRIGGSGFLFDSDLNPEGLAWKLDHQQWHAVLGTYYLNERSNDDNIMLYAAQGAFEQAFTNSFFRLGAGYYDYDNLQGAPPIYRNEQSGNRFDDNNRMLNDFNIAEFYAHYENHQLPRPLSLFTSYLKNTAADSENEAFIAGFKYGSTKKTGDWQLGYSYQYTEADAVYGLFNDSDFAGGETDSRGHTYQIGYGLNKNISMSLTWIDSVRGMHLGTATDYDRLMLDLSYWFK